MSAVCASNGTYELWMALPRQTTSCNLSKRFLKSIARRLHGEACAYRSKLQFRRSMCAQPVVQSYGSVDLWRREDRRTGRGRVYIYPSLLHLYRTFHSSPQIFCFKHRTEEAMMRTAKRNENTDTGSSLVLLLSPPSELPFFLRTR